MKMTVTQYAKKVGISRQAVRKQIVKGQLTAEKLGNYWVITV